jgi:hypothetical protein
MVPVHIPYRPHIAAPTSYSIGHKKATPQKCPIFQQFFMVVLNVAFIV